MSGGSHGSTFKRVDEVLEVAEAGVVALLSWDVLHGALDEREQDVLLRTLLLHAEEDEALVVAASEVAPEVLDAVERAGGNGQSLELEVHGEGGGAEVVRLVSPKHKKWQLEERLRCLRQLTCTSMKRCSVNTDELGPERYPARDLRVVVDDHDGLQITWLVRWHPLPELL